MQELTKEEFEFYKKNLTDKAFRMSHLYSVLDKSGKPVIYKHNPNQEKIFRYRWYNILELKSRRIGSTTGWAIDTLDFGMWIPNLRIGIISELNSSAAKIVEKIKFAHDNMVPEFRERNPIVVDNKYELKFKNGTTIYSDTSYRGETLQRLIISEFGPICAERPDKAKRIVAGALSTVDTGQEVIIESTAKGPGGYFHQFVMEAHERQKRGIKPTKMDYYLIFIPYWQDPECVLDPTGVTVSQRHTEYFKKVEEQIKVKLTPAQKAFWIKKEAVLGPDILSEYPATVDEAFAQNDEGKYYRNEFVDIYADKRITKVPFERGIPVSASFDIGVNHTVMWLGQSCGAEEHIIGCYDDTEGKPIDKFFGICTDLTREFGYHFDYFFWPHDIRVRQQFAADATRWLYVTRLFGADRCVVCPGLAEGVNLKDGIQTTRQFLARCIFDADKCDEGIKGLQNYSMEWSEHLQRYMEGSPRKDAHSDFADSFRYMAIMKAIIRGRGMRRSSSDGGSIQVVQSIPEDVIQIWNAFT